MKENILEIPFFNLSLSFIPLVLLFIIFLKMKLDWKTLLYATGRMLIQLLSIGYFLTIIFKQSSPVYSFLIVSVMIIISGWISLFSIKHERLKYIKLSLLSLIIGATPVLFLVTYFVIPTKLLWYHPSFLIPLAGMVFSKSLNFISLSAERYLRELKNGVSIIESKKEALRTAFIPEMNSFLAVGLVSLPGMMTGQILSGVDPLIAVRYQIVVMTMIMGAGGLAACVFLYLISKNKN